MNKSLKTIIEDMENGVVPPHDNDEDLVKTYGKAVRQALEDSVEPVETDFDALLVGLEALCQCHIESTSHGEYHSDMDPHTVLRFVNMMKKAHEEDMKEAEVSGANVPAVCISGPANGKDMFRALDVISKEIMVNGNSAKTGLSLFDIKKLCDEALKSKPDVHDSCIDDHDAIYRFRDYHKTLTGRDVSNAFDCGAMEAIRFIYMPQHIVEEIEGRQKHE